MGAGSRRHPITGNLPSTIPIIQWRGAIPGLSTSRSEHGLVASTTAGRVPHEKSRPPGDGGGQVRSALHDALGRDTGAIRINGV
jgi:hypothetical protein